MNEDPNEQVYEYGQTQFTSDLNDDDNFPFNADIFTDDTNDVESDDFYGRTREIIIFAEKGNLKLN